MVKILDCTLRDGGHQNNWIFDDTFVNNLLQKSKSENFDYFEIGYRNRIDKEGKGNFFYCTKNVIEKYTFNKNNLKIGVMADYKRLDLDDFKSAKEDNIDFIRIACHPDKIKESIICCEKLKNNGYNIFLQLMEIPNLEHSHYKILEEWNSKEILISLYIADTYSRAKPQDIKNYFDNLYSIGFERVSFHSHNGKGLALENTITAIECGAYSIDVSQNGLGGNLNYNDFKNCL